MQYSFYDIRTFFKNGDDIFFYIFIKYSIQMYHNQTDNNAAVPTSLYPKYFYSIQNYYPATV